MNVQEIQELAASLALAKCEAEKQKAANEAETARLQMEATKFGLERGKRPSSFMGPLVMFYDDIGSRWGASYGSVAENIVAMLPAHITETGVTAYGASPEEAMMNFDKLWTGETNVNDEPDI